MFIHLHVTFKLKMFHLWQTNFATFEELTGSAIGTCFILSCI